MAVFWAWLDRTWLGLASVKMTFVVLGALLVLSIPGTVVLQYNISNVDPGLQYSYDFWKWGQWLQLFSSYQSFWYVGLIVLLSMNLIACSVERWPQMWKLATARPVALSDAALRQRSGDLTHEWKTELSKEAAREKYLQYFKDRGHRPQILRENENSFQIFFQSGRWSRLANYLVHTSLLVIFAGAIWSSMFGFEGAANIPTEGAVDSFLIFKEGKGSGLEPAPGGLENERLLGFRIRAEDFQVHFYEGYPGRAREYVSQVQILENGAVMKTGTLRVNEPMKYKNFVLYQASYGRLGDFRISMRAVDKKDPFQNQEFYRTRLGEPQKMKSGVELVALRAHPNVQGLGPGVQFQEFRGKEPASSPFWVLKDYPQFDFVRRSAPYGIVLDEVEELYFTGLQIGSDPGAPVYWLGCLGLLAGTFYALFVTHRKYYLNFHQGQVSLLGMIHRLPLGFQGYLKHMADELRAT